MADPATGDRGGYPSSSLSRTQQRRAAGLLLSAVRAKHIDRQRRATGSNSDAARGHSTVLSSKCGQCHVERRVEEAEHRRVNFYFITISAVFTACAVVRENIKYNVFLNCHVFH